MLEIKQGSSIWTLNKLKNEIIRQAESQYYPQTYNIVYESLIYDVNTGQCIANDHRIDEKYKNCVTMKTEVRLRKNIFTWDAITDKPAYFLEKSAYLNFYKCYSEDGRKIPSSKTYAINNLGSLVEEGAPFFVVELCEAIKFVKDKKYCCSICYEVKDEPFADQEDSYVFCEGCCLKRKRVFGVWM